VSDTPPQEDLLWLVDVLSLFHEHGIGWSLYNFMTRTSMPRHQEHLDCNLYVRYSPTGDLFEHRAKRRIVEYFARQEGDVLAIGQPRDEAVTLCGHVAGVGTRRRAELLLTNKSRDKARVVRICLRGGARAGPIRVHTISRIFCDWTRLGDLVPRGPVVPVDLPMLSIKRLSVPISDQHGPFRGRA
jgi:hypothetical protein